MTWDAIAVVGAMSSVGKNESQPSTFWINRRGRCHPKIVAVRDHRPQAADVQVQRHGGKPAVKKTGDLAGTQSLIDCCISLRVCVHPSPSG